MLLITGATGNLGGSVVKHLLTKIAKQDFIVTSSNDAGVQRLKSQGLNARLADFSQPDTLVDAFQGVDKVLLVSTMDPARFEQHKNVIDAAKSAGVQTIVYTSLAIQDIETSGVRDLMISHFQTEDYLKESGLNYTILRNTMYADALQQIVGEQAIVRGGFALPGGEGKVPYALRDEMGEATANLLLSEVEENQVFNFTGSHSYSYAEIAQALSKVKGVDIQYSDIEEGAFKAILKENNFPDFAIYLHSGTILDIKNRQYELTDNSLERFLGRPTSTATEFLKKIF